MLNWVFLFLVVASVLTGAFSETMPKVNDAWQESAKTAVEIALRLIGPMALWLGFMNVVRQAGLLASLAHGLRPVMRRLFPDVPPDHPAMGAMIMNIAANMLGLGNAATPFGIKAMHELNKLNARPGVATNAMALFLAINTSGLAVLPLGAVTLRAQEGSTDAGGIIVPSILATFVSTLIAIALTKGLERLRFFRPDKYATTQDPPKAEPAKDIANMAEAEAEAAAREGARGPRLALVIVVLVAIAAGAVRFGYLAVPTQGGAAVARAYSSQWLVPVLMVLILLFGVGRQVKVYEALIAGAKEGFQIVVNIIPFLVAILVAIGMFRASGALDAIINAVGPWTSRVGFPAEALPMALIRPLSGSGSLGVFTDTLRAHGPDSFIGYLVSIISGSSETTFYVLAVYYGSIQVRAERHTLAACLSADLIGLLVAVLVTHIFFG